MEQITVEATLENLQTVIDFATEQLEARDCPMKTSMQLELVIEEIFVNISSYAYHPEIGSATFCMEFVENPDAVLMTFIDGGKDIGGLGIFLVKKNVDEINYEYADGKNILRMKKFF